MELITRKSLAILVVLMLYFVPAQAVRQCYEKTYNVTVPVIGVTLTENGMKGVVGNLTVTVAYPGNGSIYISSEPLTQVDTQGIARVAVLVASTIAKVDWTKYDFFFQFKTPSIIVGGPSAGMAMTVAVYAALTHQKPRPDVAGTGTISPDGTIGPVGGTYYKLKAAWESGYKVFLIPYGEENVSLAKSSVISSPFGIIRNVRVEQVNLIREGKKLGIKVIPVKTIFDAMRYWLTNPPEIPKPMNVTELPKDVKSVMEKWVDYYLSLYREYSSLVEGLSQTSIELMNEANAASQEAQILRNKDVYSAVNYAFTAAIRAETAYWYDQLIVKGFRTIITLSNEVEHYLTNDSKALKKYELKYFDTNHLDILLTVANRYIKAKYYYYKSLNSTNLDQIIQYLIYAKYYALASQTWSQLLSLVKNGSVIDRQKFNRTAEAIYSSANSILGYIVAMNINLDRNGIDAINIYKTAATESPLVKMAAGMYLNAILTYELHMNYSVSIDNVLNKSKYAAELAYALAKKNDLNPLIATIYLYSANKLQKDDEMGSILFYELASMHIYTLLQLTHEK